MRLVPLDHTLFLHLTYKPPTSTWGPFLMFWPTDGELICRTYVYKLEVLHETPHYSFFFSSGLIPIISIFFLLNKYGRNSAALPSCLCLVPLYPDGTLSRYPHLTLLGGRWGPQPRRKERRVGGSALRRCSGHREDRLPLCKGEVGTGHPGQHHDSHSS